MSNAGYAPKTTNPAPEYLRPGHPEDSQRRRDQPQRGKATLSDRHVQGEENQQSDDEPIHDTDRRAHLRASLYGLASIELLVRTRLVVHVHFLVRQGSMAGPSVPPHAGARSRLRWW